MTNESAYCTPDAACHLDAKPYTAIVDRLGRYEVRCDRCNEVWWHYESPRYQIAVRDAAKASS